MFHLSTEAAGCIHLYHEALQQECGNSQTTMAYNWQVPPSQSGAEAVQSDSYMLHLDVPVKQSVIVEAACAQRQEVLCCPVSLQSCVCHQKERGSY